MYMCKIILLISFFAALFITYFMGAKLIPILKRIKCAQTTKEIGPYSYNLDEGNYLVVEKNATLNGTALATGNDKKRRLPKAAVCVILCGVPVPSGFFAA